MAQNPKTEIKKSGSWLSGHRGNNDNSTDDIPTLKKSIEEKNQIILQRDQTISQRDALISQKDKLVVEKDETISNLSKENENLKNQVKELESKIQKLESELEARKSAPASNHPSSSNKHENNSNTVELPEPSGRLRESNNTTQYDICILYYSETGSPCAQNLLAELAKTALKATSVEAPFDLNDQTARNNIETTIASSRSLVVVLSKSVLQIPSALYAMKCALAYSLRIVLVHDNESCLFPGVTEQPLFLIKADVFYDKAITYFKDYASTCVESIVKKLTKQKTAVENVDTRAFLSHKRSTAQGIAGRIFQGLKADYKIFLDSDAEFDLHDLKELVKHTKLFIFILSEGIFESKWCMQELRAAVDFGKKIFVLRDFQYNLPEVLPPQVTDLAYLFQNTPPLVYMAELFDACIQRIKDELGPPDAVIHSIERDEKLMKRIQGKDFEKNPSLKLTQDFVLGHPMEGWLQGLHKYFDVPFHLLEVLDLSNCDDFISLSGVKYITTFCPNLKKINFAHTNLNSESLKALTAACPTLEDIDLDGCQIDSDSVASLGTCANLKRINLNGTRMEEKAIISAVTPLQHLETLQISSCSFREALGQILATKAATLTYLDINTTSVANHLVHLTPCVNLKTLDLRSINLKDGVMEQVFPSWPNLEVLDLASNNFTEAGLKFVSDNCHKLKSIRFQGVQLTAASMEALVTGCPLLTHLDFQTNSVVDEVATAVAKLHLLELLVIDSASLTDSGLIPIIENNPKLKFISAYQSKITDEVAKKIAECCPELKEINLEHTKTTDEGWKAILEKCQHLEVLKAGRTWISDATFQHYATLTFPSKLTHISLTATGITGESLKAIVQRAPNLSTLNVFYLTSVTDEGFQHVGQLKELTTLGVSETTIGNKGLKAIAEGCPKLQELYLDRCSNWSESVMDIFGKNCKVLKKLSLNSTMGNLTETACKNLAQLHNIQYLSVVGCHTLKDAGLGYILKSNPNMRVLHIASSKQLSDITLKNVADYCPKIREVYMSNLPEVTDKGMRALGEGAKHLKAVQMNLCQKLTFQGKKFVEHAIVQ